MPGTASKCFKTDSNQFKSSKDHINKKKAKVIYDIVSQQPNTNIQLKEDGSEYNGPVFIDGGGFLGAVGGYNTENYNLKLNIAKGRAYSETQCIIRTDNSTNITTDIILNNENKQCVDSVSKCQAPNSTYELYEGPFLQKNKIIYNLDVSADCPLESRLQYTYYDPSNITSTSHSFEKLAVI